MENSQDGNQHQRQSTQIPRLPFYGLEEPRSNAMSGIIATSGVHLWNSTNKRHSGQKTTEGTLWEAYRHRGTWDWCRLCHSGHCSWQCGGHCCCDTTGAGDVCAVTLGAHHLSLVTGSWWRVCGCQRGDQLTSTCFYHHRFPRNCHPPL